MENFLLKGKTACVSSINFAIISKMFYLFIRLSKWQRTAIGPMLIYMGRIMSRWQNPSSKFLGSKIFHLFTRLKNQSQPWKLRCKGLWRRFTRTAWPLKSQVSVAITLLNSIAVNSIKPWVVLSLKPFQPFRPKWKNQISTCKSKSEKKQPTSLMKPLREQVAFLLVRLAKGCSCFLVGSTLQ